MSNLHKYLIVSRDNDIVHEIKYALTEDDDENRIDFDQTSFKGDLVQKCHQCKYEALIIVGYSTSELISFFNDALKWLSMDTLIVFSTSANLNTVFKSIKISSHRKVSYPIDIHELQRALSGEQNINKQILLVDDTEFNREYIKECLRDYSCKIYEAKNGKEAIEAISQVNFDLVLLDYMLPDFNGDKVLREIRKKYSTSELPVIVVSAQDDMKNVQELIKIGMNDYIVKPVQVNLLLNKMNKLLNISSNQIAA